MDLLLDTNAIVDSCIIGKPDSEKLGLAIDECVRSGGRVWVYVGSVQALEHASLAALKEKKQAEKAPLPDDDQLRKEVLKLLSQFTADKHWLAALADEGPVFSGSDLDREQLLRALSRFPVGSIMLLSQDEAFSAAKPGLVITPQQYLDSAKDDKGIDFIDLKGQQDQLRPLLEQRIHSVLHHGQYVLGPEVGELERRLAEWVGVEHCISCASGTDALLMALMALDIGPGDEVITVPYTWISTAEVIALLRAKTVFVDILPDTFNMDPDKLVAAISPRTKAIIPVGIYGQPADMQRINKIAAAYNLPVIEDAAQCFGATHHGQMSCNLSRIGCTSFFPSKPLGCYGDGGAIFTPDGELAEKLRQIRIHGQKVKHQHPLIGINGRLDTLQAAILLEKFSVFPDECARRGEVACRYDSLLAKHQGVITPKLAAGNSSVYAQYTILAKDRDACIKSLRSSGVPAVAYYTSPLHLQGAFADLGYQPGDFPVTEQVAAQCLSLPMSPYLTSAEQSKVAEALSRKAS